MKKIPNITLPTLRERPELVDMLLLKKDNRLSITLVEQRHWKIILKIKYGDSPRHTCIIGY